MVKYRKQRWFAVQTYTAYEERVAQEIIQRASSLGIEDKIIKVLVPKENQIELKNGKRKVVAKKILQGYVLVKTYLNENGEIDKDSWSMIRNTPNVTDFVGEGRDSNGRKIPTPIEEHEMEKIIKRTKIEDPKYKMNYEIGDVVKIVDGPFRDQEGLVSEVNSQKGILTVLINVFGRETPMKLDALQVNNLKKD